MASKITTDMIKSFSGTGDVVAWLAKVKLVASLKNIEDIAKFVPLFLEGDALALYLQLSDNERSNYQNIEKRLLEAFTDSPFVAFSKLTQKRWGGEQVDVFANELKRLGGLAGFSGTGLDRLVRLTFVNGFPDSISCELQQMSGAFEVELSDLISRARVLTANKTGAGMISAAVVHEGRPMVMTRTEPSQNQRPRAFRGSCYRCGGPHMARFCNNSQVEKEIVCYRCNEVGHIASRCSQIGNGATSQRNQGNGSWVARAPAATQSK